MNWFNKTWKAKKKRPKTFQKIVSGEMLFLLMPDTHIKYKILKCNPWLDMYLIEIMRSNE